MAYTQRYKKEGCTAAKDVDFGKILTLTKVKVPPMVTSSFIKKVAGASKPFDVFVEVDGDNGKSRIVIKKLAASDVNIDWTDPSVNGNNAGVLKVKAVIMSWNITKETTIKQLDAVVAKVKTQKDLVKQLEANPTDPAAVARIATIKDALVKAVEEGKGIFEKFDSWYLAGPRKGTGPLLTTNKVDESKLDRADKDEFATAVMDISQKANEVKNTWQMDISGAVQQLMVRLDNFQSMVTKSKGEAVVEIRQRITTQVEALKQSAEHGLVALKLEHSIALGEEFKARKGAGFDRLKVDKKIILATIEANNTRLKTADTSVATVGVATVEKEGSRITKSIPAAFQADPQLLKLTQDIIRVVQGHKKAIADAKVALAQASGYLNAYAQTM
jgi:hypothetical protein